MIGGRGAKIIVEARGAYLAGNLRALIERLDATQRECLHRRLVEQAIRHARRAAPDYAWHPSVQPVMEASTQALEIADRWLNDRDPQASYDMIAVLADAQIVSMTNCVSSYGMMFAFLSCALLTASMDDIVFWIERSISCSLAHRRKSRQLTDEQYRCAKQAAAHWQVETAWAILQRREMPIIEV